INVAQAIKKEEEAQRKNEAIFSKIVEINRFQNEKQRKGVQISELRMLEHYKNHLEEQLFTSNQELEILQKHVVKSKTILREKAKEEKTWQNLKDEELTIF